MTPQEADYWAKIMKLKDAEDITAEQQAFRRKIEMDMPHEERREAAE